MASIADGEPPHDPRTPNGWLGQVLAALWFATFTKPWTPWVRIVLTAFIAVGLWLAVKHLA